MQVSSKYLKNIVHNNINSTKFMLVDFESSFFEGDECPKKKNYFEMGCTRNTELYSTSWLCI